MCRCILAWRKTQTQAQSQATDTDIETDKDTDIEQTNTQTPTINHPHSHLPPVLREQLGAFEKQFDRNLETWCAKAVELCTHKSNRGRRWPGKCWKRVLSTNWRVRQEDGA